MSKKSIQAQTAIAELIPLLSNTSETPNGGGSNLNQAKDILEHLPKIFKKFKIKSMIDAPCGDWNWMQTLDLKGIQYYGYDVMPEYIEDNIERFASDTVSFKEMDIVEEKISPAVDLILCRDFLMHIKWDGIKKIINNFKKSKSKYLLATNFSNYEHHDDGYHIPIIPNSLGLNLEGDEGIIPQWGWRPLNLLLEPFNFPEPIYSFVETGEHCGGRSVCMWKLEDINANFKFEGRGDYKPVSEYQKWKDS